MNFSDYQKQMVYYHALEDEFFCTESYVSIEKDNFTTFSMQYSKILLLICSEIDMLLKRLCKKLNKDFSGTTITAYYEIINARFESFKAEEVNLELSNIILSPWSGWTKSCAPVWWIAYNKIKHQRIELDDAGKPYFWRGNILNTLNALAALFIVEQYLLYLGEKEIEESQIKNHYSLFLLFKSNRLRMQRWQVCYQSFLGQQNFAFDKLKALMAERVG